MDDVELALCWPACNKLREEGLCPRQFEALQQAIKELVAELRKEPEVLIALG